MENLQTESNNTQEETIVRRRKTSSQNTWNGPDTLTIPHDHDHDGYGFSLRYFLLHATKSASPTKGFHRDSYWIDIGLQDAEEAHLESQERQTHPVDIFYAQGIKEGGAAHRAGLRSGDRVVSINGQLIGGKSYKDVVETIQTCNGDLKLGVLPHNEDILQSVYEEFIYDDKPLVRKERSNSTASAGSLKMYQQPSVNKWSVPLAPRKSTDSANSANDIFNNNNGETEKKYEPCVQFIAGAPMITVDNKSSRSGSVSSSGTATPMNRLSSGKISPARRNSSHSTNSGKFDPCVSFVAGKSVSVTSSNGSPKEDDKEVYSTDAHAQKLQTALRKEANKKVSVGKRLAPKMIEGVSKPGAVSNMAELFAGNNFEENMRRPSVTSCLRDDFQSRARKVSESSKENDNQDRHRSDVIRPVNQRKPLTSLTSQATLVESTGKLLIDKNSTNTFILNKNGQKNKTTPPSRQRTLISNSRKTSISSSVENSDDEESYIDSADESELNNWQGRRTSYLRIAAAKKEQKKNLNGETNVEADDEDSDTNAQSPTKQQPTKGVNYEARPIIKEGPLNRKLERSLDRKKPSQRTWKPIYAVLKGHRLFCYKDGGNNEAFDDEIIQPIPVRSAIIKIASDYTKRRHVFRLVTSHGNEYLFQAEDTTSMMSWVHTLIDTNPDPEGINATHHEKKESHQFNSLSTSLPAKTHSIKDKKNGSSIRRAYERTIRKNRSGTIKNKEAPIEVGKTFGYSLQNCPQAKEVKNVPLLVEHCCNVIEDKGKEVVGIYRVPGNAAAWQALQKEFDAKNPEEIEWTDEKWYELNNLGSLLKSFLRKLEEPVIPTTMYNKFVQANRIINPVERVKQMKNHVKALPEYHYETLQFLMQHLKVIADHSDENKMDPTNLAIVFGPTVVRTKEQSMVSMVENMSDQCKIIETLLKQCDWMFSADDEEPANIEQEVDVISDNAHKGLRQCLNNQQNQIILGVAENNNNTWKKSNKFSTFSKLSMKMRNNTSKVTSPKPLKKNSKTGSICEDESDIDTSGCSSQSPQMSEKTGTKTKHRKEISTNLSTISNTIPIPKFPDNSQIGSYIQNSNMKLKFESPQRNIELSPEMVRKDTNTHKLSEKTMNRLNKMTSVFTKSDDSKYMNKDDGNDSGVTSPQRFDSDENISNSDSATSSRKESFDSLSGPSPRINRRTASLVPRKYSAGSGGSSNDEKSPTLPKSSFVGSPTCPSVKEEKETLDFNRGAAYLRGSVRGTADTRGANSVAEDPKYSVVKRSEWRQRMNLPVSPRSAKRPLCSIMPGDGNKFDEKIQALLDTSNNTALKEQAKTEMNLTLNLSSLQNKNSSKPSSPLNPYSEWWSSGGTPKKIPTTPKDKADAVTIISTAIETKKRNNSENKDPFLSRRTPHSPLDPELTARFDNLKQKEEDYNKKVDSILASSSSPSLGGKFGTKNTSNNEDRSKKSFLSKSRAEKLDNYLKQVSQLLEEGENAEINAEEREKINSILNNFKQNIAIPKTETSNRRLLSDSKFPTNSYKKEHVPLSRSKSANSNTRKELMKNRTSPFLDPTYSNFNYTKLYP